MRPLFFREVFVSVREKILLLEQSMLQEVIGQESIIRSVIVCLLCDANVLLEGMPGLAKTRSVKSLAKYLDAKFQRIQFTPDLLPTDITGSDIYVADSQLPEDAFQFRQGPIFGNIVLVDEINRAPPKVQSALLEAMEERQVTVSGKSHRLDKLFMTLATQNPVEQEGTYNLPEAQLDRFLMKILVQYPKKENEKDIMRLVRRERTRKYSQLVYSEQDSFKTSPSSVQLSQDVIFSAWGEISDVHVSDAIEDYVVSIIDATRNPTEYDVELAEWIVEGASPRATLALDVASRAHAWLEGRDYVTPMDVHAIIYNVLRHRLVLSFQAVSADVTSDIVISKLLSTVVVG
ncbi:AAA family ATPase [Vibrio parahaemolyticus]|uniref:AAA family ATPase n=1 Tax=Vibrio parahaemolyticus TaxID=670 RepID=UPI003EBDA470